jgi:hypothetical protein
MGITRRRLLTGGAAAAGLAAVNIKSLAQTAIKSVAPGAGSDTYPPDAQASVYVPANFTPVPAPETAAAKALYGEIGADAWTELNHHLQTVNFNIQANGLRHIPGTDGTFLTGYPSHEFYDWDLYFENIYLSYYGVWRFCYTNLKEFLARQQPDGYISRSLINKRDRQHFKPFLAQLVVLGARQDNNDYEWLRGNYYARLAKYLVKWFSYDGDGNGLPVWNSADAAGTDNQWSRGGPLASFSIEGADLAAYLVRELRAMVVIATALGLKADAAAYSDHADALVKLINETFWDETTGMYYDRNEKTGKLVNVKSATSFTVLFAGAPSAERAKRMIHEHLLNPDEFWLAYPVASYAKTEADYYQGAHFNYGTHKECNWRGPSWAPTNYMIFQGLRKYGYNDVAHELAKRLFNMTVVKNPVLREYYNAETGDGLGQLRFWGFTDMYYGMLLESITGYDSSSLDKPFRAIMSENLGVVFPDVSKI